MTIEQLYRDWAASDETARELLDQTHWFSCLADFDPLTAEALPQALGAVLRKPVPEGSCVLRDRVWRLVEHARASMVKLFRELNESPRREHAVLPLRSVREMDTVSFMALSRRPGRNIREKLAGRPYLLAVRHFQSIDLPENRLLKAFAERLTEVLELRAALLGDAQDKEDGFDGLLEILRAWLVSDEAVEIGRWENLPPNNTLLTHRNYRAVYDAWCWLQTLDDDLSKDVRRLDARRKTMKEWTEYRRRFAAGGGRRTLFAEMPVLFDYEKFEIRPWLPRLVSIPAEGRAHPAPQAPVPAQDGVCIDLTELFPRYAVADGNAEGGARAFAGPFAWQLWERDGESVDIGLFESDATCLHAEATTVTAPDLFFSASRSDSPRDRVLFDRAARAFSEKLRGTFGTRELVWLVPDSLNDFELEIIRRNLNACFPEAEPLPRSIAAVFENTDFQKLHPGHAVVVIDSVGGKPCATKLEARRDKELARRLPETHGFYWERHPPVLLEDADSADGTSFPDEPPIRGMMTVDGNGNWQEPRTRRRMGFVAPDTLRNDERIGNFQRIINLSGSPVLGGIRLHAWQKRAGEIPLWRDQIPELSIKARENGRYQRVCLVSRGTSIRPLRGQAVRIPVRNSQGEPATFTLPMGKDRYHIPLLLGEDEEQLGFSAQLASRDFPLDRDVKCDLELTFTYGADDPYRLVFKPRDASIRPIRALWERTREEIVTNAPSPDYPAPLTWQELQASPKKNSDELTDFLEWTQSAISLQTGDLYLSHQKRFTGIILRDWHPDKNGALYTHALCDDLPENVFIHSKNFYPGSDLLHLGENDRISFELMPGNNGKYVGRNIAQEDFVAPKRERIFNEQTTGNFVANIHKRLYVPIIQVWRDGRSITDGQCPPRFRKSMEQDIALLESLLSKNGLPDAIKMEIRFLLSCMHKDAPDTVIRWLTEQVESGDIRDYRAVGFSMGDVSEPWQQYVFDLLVSNPTPDALRVLANAIWRERHFVERFSLSELQAVFQALDEMMEKIVAHPKQKQVNKAVFLDWGRSATEALELLLGLLRTRESTDNEIKMLLQPHQRTAKEFARRVEDVAEVLAKEQFRLFSRIQLGNLSNPEEAGTPDLIFALRLYLTGDDGANAIEITGISDAEDYGEV